MHHGSLTILFPPMFKLWRMVEHGPGMPPIDPATGNRNLTEIKHYVDITLVVQKWNINNGRQHRERFRGRIQPRLNPTIMKIGRESINGPGIRVYCGWCARFFVTRQGRQIHMRSCRLAMRSAGAGAVNWI